MIKNGEYKRSEKKKKRKIVSPLDVGCQRTLVACRGNTSLKRHWKALI